MPGFIIGDSKERAATGGVKLNTTSSEYYTNFFWDVSRVINIDVLNKPESGALLALKDCKLPSFTVEEERYLGSSLEYKFAKKVTYEDVSMTWYDNTGLLPIMIKWMNSVLTVDRRLALASQYKYNTEIIVYTPPLSSSQKYKLHQSWPKSIKFGDLSYTSSDIKYVEATISYDFADYEEINKK